MMNKSVIKLSRLNGVTDEELKEQLITSEIRKRYSQGAENAILRKKLANIDYKDEFKVFNDYVEQCKKKVKDMIA